MTLALEISKRMEWQRYIDMPEKEDREEWRDYQRMVLHRLVSLEVMAEAHSKQSTEIQAELAHLRGRSGVWGALAGLVMAGLVSLAVSVLQSS